jgi:adenosylmethionine-8-amino-7-oxononanoate aminotransferase
MSHPPKRFAADKAHSWHPFTQMGDWCAPDHEPLLLVEGEGALFARQSRTGYIDGNSSIWTNLHGHRHPRIDAAIRTQLDCAAHTSFLGFTHPPGAELAAQLARLWPARTLTRVFFSDDGSTAIEVALKIAARFWQLRGRPERTRFAAFVDAYHGDTMGASSVGGIRAFHEYFGRWQFPAIHVRSVADLDNAPSDEIAAVLIEPLIQGAARNASLAARITFRTARLVRRTQRSLDRR